jgi:hypothetical protein
MRRRRDKPDAQQIPVLVPALARRKPTLTSPSAVPWPRIQAR